MLATTRRVREIVNELYTPQPTRLRQAWADRAVDPALRNMAFRFWDEHTADRVARDLEQRLAQEGYTNRVRRTDTAASWQARTDGGCYVRLQARYEQ